MARNHPRVLQEPIRVAMTWAANMDVRWILASHSPFSADSVENLWRVIDYVIGYACKGNKTVASSMSMYKDALRTVTKNSADKSHSSSLSYLANRIVAKTHVGQSQAVWILQGLPFFEAPEHTRKAVAMGLARRVGAGENMDGDNSLDKVIVCDRYRDAFQDAQDGNSTIPGMASMNLYEFASGPAHEQPVGTYVPLSGGVGPLRPKSAGG